MTIPEILAVLVVVVAAPLNWIVAFLLVRLSLQNPRLNRVLRAHALAATALAVIVTIFAAVFVNNGMKPPVLDLGGTQLLTRGSLLVLSVVPALYWIVLYRRGADPEPTEGERKEEMKQEIRKGPK